MSNGKYIHTDMKKLLEEHQNCPNCQAALVGILLGAFYAFRTKGQDWKSILGFAFLGGVSLYFLVDVIFKPKDSPAVS